jgi:hypothetical protein
MVEWEFAHKFLYFSKILTHAEESLPVQLKFKLGQEDFIDIYRKTQLDHKKTSPAQRIISMTMQEHLSD